MLSLVCPISASIFSTLLGLFIIFLYNKSKNNENERSEYLKIALLIFCVSYTTMYLRGNNFPIHHHINNSKILTGNPTF